MCYIGSIAPYTVTVKGSRKLRQGLSQLARLFFFLIGWRVERHQLLNEFLLVFEQRADRALVVGNNPHGYCQIGYCGNYRRYCCVHTSPLMLALVETSY